jgi:hypothetical protein
MAKYWNSVLLVWEDLSGQQVTFQWNTQDQSNSVPGPLAALGASAQALSSCKLRAMQYVTTSLAAGAAATGDYPSAWDRAVMLTKLENTYGQLQIPGPKATVFKDDHQTIDYDNPQVAAFVAQALSVLGGKTGSPLLSVYAGGRSKVRNGVDI